MRDEVEVLSVWILVRNKDGDIYLRPATGEDMVAYADKIKKEMGQELGLSPFAFGSEGNG